MSFSVSAAYDARVRAGQFLRDPAQEAAARRLDALAAELAEYRLARKSSALGWLFGSRRASHVVKGLYIWGAVGRGKTMLMDLFFESTPVVHKRRVHFHAFMADVHRRVHDWRQKLKAGAVKGDDPIQPVADALADEAWLLCFDEFAVTDIADAMILGRLFTALFARGVVVVATSNVEPSRLYEGGLNRSLFLPFIALLREKLDVMTLEAAMDYRLDKLTGSPVYHTPADEEARAALDRMFLALTGVAHGEPMQLPLLGRAVEVPQAHAHVARFAFDDLCGKPLGSVDFLAIAEAFHTILIDDIPVLPPHKRNEAKRFINLIDTLYDQKVKLVCSAQAPPSKIYVAEEGREAFEFDRTVSRLTEMQSIEYLASPHGRSTPSGDTAGLVET